MSGSLVALTQGTVPVTWERLFQSAMIAIDEIAKHGRDNPFWTLGGGTVLMLRYGHRFSKDIDIFVPDPQSLGFVNPRLSDVVESLTTEYDEAAGYIKLFLPEGEVDFVAAPNLTSPGYEVVTLLGREVKVETSVEIIAKKMWHRGDRITGRDIFDFALVAQHERDELLHQREFMLRHADVLLGHLESRYTALKVQFEAVDTLGYHPRFDDAIAVLRTALQEMMVLSMTNDFDHTEGEGLGEDNAPSMR